MKYIEIKNSKKEIIKQLENMIKNSKNYRTNLSQNFLVMKEYI